MRKQAERKAVQAAERIVAALKSAKLISRDAQVEVRVRGQKQKTKKRQAKPRGRAR
jgi:hypothetical protein